MWILSGVYVGCSATFIELPSSPAAAAAAAAGSHLASSIEKLCAYLRVCVRDAGSSKTICGSLLPEQPANKSDKLEAVSLLSLSLCTLSLFFIFALLFCCLPTGELLRPLNYYKYFS